MNKILITSIFLFFIFTFPVLATTSSDGVNIFVVVHNCNDNGICEPELGENYFGCPLDCLPPPPPPIEPPPVHHGSGVGGSYIIFMPSTSTISFSPFIPGNAPILIPTQSLTTGILTMSIPTGTTTMTPAPLMRLEGFDWWSLYWAVYYVDYFFGPVNYFVSILI